MNMTAKEREYADRLRRSKAELKRAEVATKNCDRQMIMDLKKRNRDSEQDGAGNILRYFLIACLAVLEMDGLRLEDI